MTISQRVLVGVLIAVLSICSFFAIRAAIRAAIRFVWQPRVPSYCQSVSAMERFQQQHPDLMIYCGN